NTEFVTKRLLFRCKIQVHLFFAPGIQAWVARGFARGVARYARHCRYRLKRCPPSLLHREIRAGSTQIHSKVSCAAPALGPFPCPSSASSPQTQRNAGICNERGASGNIRRVRFRPLPHWASTQRRPSALRPIFHLASERPQLP